METELGMNVSFLKITQVILFLKTFPLPIIVFSKICSSLTW